MGIIKIFFCVDKDEGFLPYPPRGVMPPGWVPPSSLTGRTLPFRTRELETPLFERDLLYYVKEHHTQREMPSDL